MKRVMLNSSKYIYPHIKGTLSSELCVSTSLRDTEYVEKAVRLQNFAVQSSQLFEFFYIKIIEKKKK
jgi:hypothetical protein